MSEKYLVARGEGKNRRWMDGMGPDSVFSWTTIRANATAYNLTQACNLVDRITHLLPSYAAVEIELVDGGDGDEFGAVRRQGQG